MIRKSDHSVSPKNGQNRVTTEQEVAKTKDPPVEENTCIITQDGKKYVDRRRDALRVVYFPKGSSEINAVEGM